MRLKPVENSPEPDYPDYDKFHQDRRGFLARMGALAGALLAGTAMSGCAQEESPRTGGSTAAPKPPLPKDASRPTQPTPDPLPPNPPSEHLRGEIAEPEPIVNPPEPHIAGGLRAPCPPGKGVIEEKPELPADPEPPKDSPKDSPK